MFSKTVRDSAGLFLFFERMIFVINMLGKSGKFRPDHLGNQRRRPPVSWSRKEMMNFDIRNVYQHVDNERTLGGLNTFTTGRARFRLLVFRLEWERTETDAPAKESFSPFGRLGHSDHGCSAGFGQGTGSVASNGLHSKKTNRKRKRKTEAMIAKSEQHIATLENYLESQLDKDLKLVYEHITYSDRLVARKKDFIIHNPSRSGTRSSTATLDLRRGRRSRTTRSRNMS